MTKLRNLLFLTISMPVLIILIWLVAIPDDSIKAFIENSISDSGKSSIDASIKGLKKGIFFTVYAESLELSIDSTPALRVTDISSKINPLHLFKKQIAFSVRGKIGTGDVRGSFKLPGKGTLKIDRAEINAIPYLAYTALKGSGLISARLNLKDELIDAVFEISDADIRGSAMGIPLPISSFRKIQGALTLKENTINITSINLEGDRGYARLKGDITNGVMNLILELMPSAGELNSVESMLISRYLVSPGYYVIPIRGKLL